jgi:lysophospholipase L1-like esterase
LKLPNKLQLTLTAAAILSSAGASAQQPVWTGSWAAAPMAAPASGPEIGADGTTFRDIVHLSLGGAAIRLRISNEFGATPLTLGDVHIALSAGADKTQPQSDHAVTFGGTAVVTIPAGALAVSDAIALPVRPFVDLAVSIFVPAQPGISITQHSLAVSTNYVAAGDVAAAASIESATKAMHWNLLAGVDVDAGPRAAAAVILGASISDGYHSTPDKNLRWPDDLAVRLHNNPATAQIGVLNEGISGARLLHDVTGQSALARLDRDVLAQPGAKYVIVSIGTNDIGHTFFPIKPHQEVTAEQMDWSLQQIVARAHARGIKVFVTTLTPFGGAAYWSPAGEQMRLAFNTYIRTSGIFDGVIDFDLAAHDPTHPEALPPAIDSGDHLHPNDAGYQALADSIDLKLFTK